MSVCGSPPPRRHELCQRGHAGVQRDEVPPLRAPEGLEAAPKGVRHPRLRPGAPAHRQRRQP
eukprot:18038-Prorocentrum_minimum.AAC.1